MSVLKQLENLVARDRAQNAIRERNPSEGDFGRPGAHPVRDRAPQIVAQRCPRCGAVAIRRRPQGFADALLSLLQVKTFVCTRWHHRFHRWAG